MTEMLYLGHVIGVNGVQVHQEKIKEIIEWPTPRNVTELKIFLGLCTYYRKFVKGFSQLTAPLIDLTKKGAFVWIEKAQETFEKMKQVMSSCPVLALPDFTQPFVLECDASEIGRGVVLMQSDHPIAFESRKLREYERHYSIYDKEMLAIMHALTKFRQYLVGNKFKVKTDHNSLKFLVEQKDLSERQQKWINKIQDYDFEIEYVTNIVQQILLLYLYQRPPSPSCETVLAVKGTYIFTIWPTFFTKGGNNDVMPYFQGLLFRLMGVL
jgi:hypothetical protein